MDDDWGYPYDLGNLQMAEISSLAFPTQPWEVYVKLAQEIDGGMRPTRVTVMLCK